MAHLLLFVVHIGAADGRPHRRHQPDEQEPARRLLSKDIPVIFKGLPSSLIYMGILSLAIYGLVGHSVAI